MPVILDDLHGLVSELIATGREVIGPVCRDGAIVLAPLTSADDLPYGWGVDVAPGEYRLVRRDDNAAFANSAGPQSWKQHLHPPRRRLWSAERTPDGFAVTEDVPERRPLAFLGVRPCDLRAIGVLDRVLGVRGRADVFVVAVNCNEPGGLCFCVSAGGGPSVDAPGNESAYDLALTELPAGYLAEAGTAVGAAVLDQLESRPGDPETLATAISLAECAEARMGRQLPPGDLRALLADSLDSPQWSDVASRCLTCGNCTMVCPTCFCTTVEDTTDLTGDHAERWELWDSCFDIGYSYLHGGSVRPSAASRYRQWLTHKLGTWHDQFGESGCVGCGRCIAWCPVGIDITAEMAALDAERSEGRP